MKYLKPLILLCVAFYGGFSPISAAESRRSAGLRYRKSFNGYILKKRNKVLFQRRNTNKPRFRLSRKNTTIPQTKTGVHTKKFATPTYERATRRQVQRAGIFCEFVLRTTPNSACLKTVNTQPTAHKKTKKYSYRRFQPSTKSISQTKKTNLKAKSVRRSFSNRYRYSRSR